MTLSLPPEWPACGAKNKTWRRQPTFLCRNPGGGWGKRCEQHGGLAIPGAPHAIVVASNGVYVWRLLRGQLHPHEQGRQRVSWRIAALLVESGRVTHGFFFGRKGASLLRRFATNGIGAEPLKALGHGTRAGLREYVFRLPERAA